MLQLREASVVDDDPLYDSVASDDDYAMVPEDKESPQKEKRPSPPTEKQSPSSDKEKDKMVSLDSVNKTNQILEQLTKQLKNSDSTITDLRSEVIKLRQCVKVLQTENTELKSRLSQSKLSSRLNGDSGFDSLEFISEVNSAK